MIKAAGYWAWWNQYGSVPLPRCVQRAKEAGIGVIVKSSYTTARAAFINAGVPWATEAYVYPGTANRQMEQLAADVAQGAEFAVLNAEVEWQRLGPELMEGAIAHFRRIQPRTELYASVDTRGNRLALPYQRVLAQRIAGWMPMIYPKAFQRPVLSSFSASLDGKDFGARPVLPTIQTYDNIGAPDVRAQVAEVERRGLPGCQAYTICHATDAEWAAFAEAAKEDNMADEALRRVVALFLDAAEYANLGQPLPDSLKGQLKYLLGA